jgi:hypothetical protein
MPGNRVDTGIIVGRWVRISPASKVSVALIVLQVTHPMIPTQDCTFMHGRKL